ncbi:hypothetical protein K469DRAFT_92370 [Zopfia rhizophila CBS 207.26]|uniref:Uncharacterized protein n=1 Tax=Zopfia rhizophila CBS 207.26 TaxID=1314779 RepID=A0A6A6E8F3_9PEZI|nr:hypothetical protein K469DRAFT_92370 [Zopfia rhizophila CBS 207.26]
MDASRSGVRVRVIKTVRIRIKLYVKAARQGKILNCDDVKTVEWKPWNGGFERNFDCRFKAVK